MTALVWYESLSSLSFTSFSSHARAGFRRRHECAKQPQEDLGALHGRCKQAQAESQEQAPTSMARSIWGAAIFSRSHSLAHASHVAASMLPAPAAAACASISASVSRLAPGSAACASTSVSRMYTRELPIATAHASRTHTRMRHCRCSPQDGARRPRVLLPSPGALSACARMSIASASAHAAHPTM